MHPWHDVPLGEAIESTFLAVIETPRESRVQYGLDLSTGLLRVKRVLFSAMQYPANYGFAPRTLADDGEPVDVLVLGQDPIHPMSIVRARPIGLLRMVQGGRRDDKIVAVHVDDPVFEPYRSWQELPPHVLAEVERFFNDYRALEGVETNTGGFGDAGDAARLLREFASRYVAEASHERPSG
jgi:inorganic pyrophosphatase